MSKILTILTSGATKGSRMRRTIRHSPRFSGTQKTISDGRHANHLPAGGYMTG